MVMKKLVMILLVVIFGLSLTGCSKSAKEYTLTFESNGGSVVPAVTFDGSGTISAITDPTKTGFQFEGWFTDEELTSQFSFKEIPTNSFTLYAKWGAITEQIFYKITYVLNGGLNGANNPISFTSAANSITLNNPTKEGFTFIGWFTDSLFTVPFNATNIPSSNISIYAKWEEVITGNTGLATETLNIHSSLYGNTNGNLNNLGLAVYDTNLDLHYYSYGASIFAYDPASDTTTLVCSLSSGGRATNLNLGGEVLYFIDSSNGFLLSYHLVNHQFTTISEMENFYASRTQSWVNFIYSAVVYGTPRIVLQRYSTDNNTIFTTQTYGIEQMNIDGTRVYYKPADQLQIYVMSYNGSGKSNIVYLDGLDVEIMHETLLLDVDNDYISYYALILTVGNSMGLYTYNSVDGLVKVMDSIGGDLHGVNYDGTNLYVITGSSALYKIDLETNESEFMMNLLGNAAYIQIINHWIYAGAYEQTLLYRINPVTNEIEYLN